MLRLFQNGLPVIAEKGLTSITISNSVTSIRNDAFGGNNNLASITIGADMGRGFMEQGAVRWEIIGALLPAVLGVWYASAMMKQLFFIPRLFRRGRPAGPGLGPAGPVPRAEGLTLGAEMLVKGGAG